jgi:hypothetical protein
LTIGEDPRTNLRRLRKLPEGVDLMVQTWEELRADLTREEKPQWTASHLVKAASLVGIRDEDARGSRIGALSRGVWGDFHAMAEHEGGEMDDEPRQAWARALLAELIDEQIAGLEAHFETLDFKMINQDRAEAGDRALFDPSKEASLARRYESEARRGFFQSLKEFRRVEAEAAEREEASPTPSPAPEPNPPLGSSWAGPSRDIRNPQPAPPMPHQPVGEVARGLDGTVLTVGRPVQKPA